jgi:hypothetical protein
VSVGVETKETTAVVLGTAAHGELAEASGHAPSIRIQALRIREAQRVVQRKRVEVRAPPRVACKDKWRRIERLQANKAWKAEYCERRDRWRAGDRDTVFPHGTYLYRVRHGVAVAERPT